MFEGEVHRHSAPQQELLIALAVPAVNVVLAALLTIVVMPMMVAGGLSDVAIVGRQFLAQLMWVNIALAVFNLLPAFPMEAG